MFFRHILSKTFYRMLNISVNNYYHFRLLCEDMQRRIESIKLENNNEDEASAKISKVEEESVSNLVTFNFYI